MARYAVIGLSNFGANVARVLFDLGNEVICLDQNESLVKQAHDYSSFGLVGPATDVDLLSSLQVRNLDAVFVCLGEEIADSILATLHLRDLEAKRIIAKIVSEDHGRILRRIGAHEVVFPERDMAVRVANYVTAPTITNYLDLTPEYSVLEVVPPEGFIGKTLAETGLRRDFGVTAIGIKDVLADQITINPEPNFVLKDSDVLIVIGKRPDLARLAGSQTPLAAVDSDEPKDGDTSRKK